MSHRISVPRGTQDMFTKDLSRQLKAIVISYRHGFHSKEVAKERGKAVIEDEFETLLRLSHDRIRWTLRRPVNLPPEERARLERWKDDYVLDFYKILDDIQ